MTEAEVKAIRVRSDNGEIDKAAFPYRYACPLCKRSWWFSAESDEFQCGECKSFLVIRQSYQPKFRDCDRRDNPFAPKDWRSGA